MSTPVEPGPYRFELELSAPEHQHFGGDIVAEPPATLEGIRDWLISTHCPHLIGKTVTITRFTLNRR